MDSSIGVEDDLSSTSGALSSNNEKLKTKLEKKLLESMKGMSEEQKIQYLTGRLCESESQNIDVKREIEELKRNNGKVSLLEKKINSLEKQLSKGELAKSKLEELCRELNKANKDEKELNQQKLKAIQLSHNETVNNLKKVLSEIQQTVESKQEHTKRVAEVEELSNHLNRLAADYDKRLKDLKKLYDDRESDMNTMTKAKEEEVLFLRGQADEMKKRVLEVFEENVNVKQQLLHSEERAQKSMQSELGLKKTLDDYSAQYSKLLESLTNSNKSFDKVKGDMARMNGNLIRVESEAKRYKAKVEEANKTIQDLILDKEQVEKDLALKNRQLVQLQDLCRRLRMAGNEADNATDLKGVKSPDDGLINAIISSDKAN